MKCRRPRRKSIWPVGALAAGLLTGCSTGGDFFEVPVGSLSSQPLDPSLTYYHAYGDSITAGATLASAAQAYPTLVAQYNHLPLSNYGIPGNQACNVAASQIFPAQDNPTVAQKGLYTLLIGTNDAYGAGPHEIPFNLCDQAALAWMGVPRENKIEATAATASGPTHVETGNHWNAVTTDAAGSALTFALQQPAAGPVYVWYRLISGNAGAFTYAVDGVVGGTMTTAPASDAMGDGSAPNSLALLRLPSVAGGSHKLTLTQTTAGLSGMGIVAVGMPFTGAAVQRPRVLTGLLPLQLNGQRQQAIEVFDGDIVANVNLLAGDGLDVEVFDAAHYMTGSKADMSDALHPNAIGHQEIFKGLEDGIR